VNSSLGDTTGTVERFSGSVGILIPAYDESENLSGLLPRLPAELSGVPVGVLVVDDGSRDGTAEAARRAGAGVLRLPINRGGGAALRAGYAVMLRAGARAVVTMDADGQHRPEDLPQLVAPILDGSADCVQGSRILGTQEPGPVARSLGISFFNSVVSLLVGRPITDCSNGFRAIRTGVLAELDLRQDQFHSAEFVIEVITRGFTFREVHVAVLRRVHGRSKKPRSLAYGFGFGRAIVTAWFRSLTRRGTSRRSDRTPPRAGR
jgi:glycosyltransferase involved in cell wall biosynthesis